MTSSSGSMLEDAGDNHHYLSGGTKLSAVNGDDITTEMASRHDHQDINGDITTMVGRAATSRDDMNSEQLVW